MKTICLNMIVKNESNTIESCLESIKKLINYWVIVDTGSDDDTKEKIKKILAEIPGELHERPWVNFAHNRNEALQFAEGKGDYVLFMDADDKLVFSDDFVLPELEADLYTITQREGYRNTFREHQLFSLVKNSGEFEWVGEIHEYLKDNTTRPKSRELLKNVFNNYSGHGCRSQDPQKCAKDIILLKKSLEEDPLNSRSVFYLARTYYSLRDYFPALTYFMQRAEMGGDPEEMYFSLLYIAIIQKNINMKSDVFLDSFCRAYLYRSSRPEAPYEIARHFAETGNYCLGYFFSKIVMDLPESSDELFIESWIHDWGAALYVFVCANQLGLIDEAKTTLEFLVNNKNLPNEVKEGFQLNQWAEKILGKTACA